MNEEEKRKKLIKSIIDKFERLERKRQDKKTPVIVPLSTKDNP
ncbi:hypothetical protein [Ruminococcus sp. Marseille-P6503]|nr:hypothetical protein [Ruminococcus sp. Marseille-P6503]